MKIDIATIEAELERILNSHCFRLHKTLQKFLAYIVTQSLAGKRGNITQYGIAVEGLGKQTDFDATENPLIRVQAGRLRKQLDAYYTSEGRFNPMRISLPNGSYQPVFTQHQAEAKHNLALLDDATHSLSQGPGIVCIPRTFVAQEALGWPFITRLARDYVTALTHFNFCQVLFADETPWRQTNWPDDAWYQYGADFALFLDLHDEASGYNLKCSLVHSLTRRIIWANSFPLGKHYPEAAILNPIFKHIAHDTLNYESGLAHNAWVIQKLDSGQALTARHQVLVAVRQYLRNPSATTFRTSLQACEQQLKKNPHDVQALLVYNKHCAAEYALKYRVLKSASARFTETTDTLLQLAPNNAYSHSDHAMACLLDENHEQCRAAAAIAQSINPLDSYLNIQLGLIYIGLDEWQTGAQLIQDTINISQNYTDWYHIPLSLYHYREGRYLAAMQEIKKVRLKHLWTPMLRTALYQCNQRLENGAQEYRKLVNEYPDFIQTGRQLTQTFPQKASRVLNHLWSHIPNQTGGKADEN